MNNNNELWIAIIGAIIAGLTAFAAYLKKRRNNK